MISYLGCLQCISPRLDNSKFFSHCKRLAEAAGLAQLASLDIALTRLPREHLSPPRKSRLGDLPGAMSRIAAKRLAAEAHYKGRLAFATTWDPGQIRFRHPMYSSENRSDVTGFEFNSRRGT